MNFKKTLTVYFKETQEMIRDRRTIFATIIMPILMYPIIFIGFNSLMSRQTAKLEAQGAIICLDATHFDHYSLIIKDNIQKIPHYQLTPMKGDVQQLYLDKKIDAVVTIKDSLDSEKQVVYRVTIKYDRSSDKGKMIFDKLNSAISNAEKSIIIEKLSEKNVSAGIFNSVKVYANDTSTSQKKLGSILGMILPYLLIMLLISGAAVVASDIVAGEKERRTLETLLVSSASRNEIVLGKYLTIITFALINVIINLFSLYFTMHRVATQSGLEMSNVKFPLDGFVVLFLALIPLATLFSAILLSISTFSRNMKEARSYEQPLLIVSMLLAMISFFPAFELNNTLALVPIINISLLFKAVLIGNYKIQHLIITIGSTLILDIIAIWTTIKLFNNEQVLFRTEQESSIKQLRKRSTSLFSPHIGILYFLVALVALYYIGSYLQQKDFVKGLLETQVFLILLPVYVFLRIFKQNPRQILRFNAPKLNQLLLVPIIIIPAAILVVIITQGIDYFFPFPNEYMQRMSKLLSFPNLSIWQTLLLISVLPGICEELLFRGFLMRFFESHGSLKAVVISAFLFAAFHLDIYKFLPVMVLGLVLGYLLIKTKSIFICMLAHALNNSLAVIASHYYNSTWLKIFLKDAEHIKYWVAIPAIVIFIIGIYLNQKITKNNNQLT